MDTTGFERLRGALKDRYLLDREIGRGGMATVFLAQDVKHRREVAIKVLRPEVAAGLGAERFLREIEIAAGLQHPHILPVYDSGNAGGALYYVMPFVEGESLRGRLNRETQLAFTDVIAIARDVSRALAYAHGRNVVHRDVKPENILLSGGHAVVADFGIARAISAAGVGSLTAAGHSLGTPAYMSPEQAAGESRIDGRTDVYALGCVVYEMLAGQPPFTGPTAQVTMMRHAVDPVPPLRSARTTVPDAVQSAVLRALAKSPADRFDTATDFADALAALATPQDPMPATQVARSLEGAWPRWRRRISMAAGAAGVLFLAALLVARGWPARQVPDAPAAARAFQASLAVLPFDYLGDDVNMQHLSAGLTDELISQLAQIERLKVISRHSVLALRGAQLTVPQIAETLGVRHILEGSVQPAGGRVRVTAQLIDASTDTHVWTRSYNRELTDVLTLREELASEVTAELLQVVGLSEAPRARSAEHSPAHEPYMEGLASFERRTPAAMREAMIAFEAAIGLDSVFAPAYAKLSSVYALSVTYRYRLGVTAYDAAGRSLALSRRAVELDSTLAEAYAARGYVSSVGMAPASLVQADFQRAMRLKPNSPSVPGWFAHLLVREGRVAEALSEARRAVELDPIAPSRRIGLAFEALRDRRYSLAVRAARQATRLEPELMLPRALEGRALLMLGRHAACARLDLGPYEGLRATCLHALGRTREAEAIIDSLITAVSMGTFDDPWYTEVVSAEDIAVYYAWTGNVASAMAWVRWAFDLSPSGIDHRLLDCGLFDKVRRDPRFADELRRIKSEIWPRVQHSSQSVQAP